MKDKLILPDIAFNATGKCKLQYTDPITGKVLMEVGGENHVFIKQFVGTTGFQETALRSDLLLCQGGTSPGDDIPVIPGDPIGYGRPGAEGSGLFRGTWRVADSYYNKRSLAKVSNKYVYDFLNTQALGRVDWIGLTGTLGQGMSTAAWDPPHPKDAPLSTKKVYNCETGDYYYIEQSGNYLYLKYANTFTDTSERSRSLYATLGTFYSGYYKVCLDAVNNRVYVLVYYKTSSSGSYLSKLILMTSDLSGVESVTDITSGGSYIQNGEFGGAHNGKLIWLHRASDAYFRVYTLDLTTMSVTSASKYPETSKNRIRWDEYTTHVYKNYLWQSRYYHQSYGALATNEGNYFTYSTPLFDMESGEAKAMMPPANGNNYYPYYYRSGVSPLSAFAGQWVNFYYKDNSPPSIDSAYTRYQVPADTPDRPEGTGMTVTYELEIEW